MNLSNDSGADASKEINDIALQTGSSYQWNRTTAEKLVVSRGDILCHDAVLPALRRRPKDLTYDFVLTSKT